MKDYSSYTRADFQSMSNKEFEEYTKQEYKIYLSQIRHEDDYFPYSEFFIEISAMAGRQDSVRKFN